MSEKILITGGSGFVGQNVIHALRAQKPSAKIYNLSRTPLRIEGVSHIPCGDAAIFNFKHINEEFDHIIHTLALSNDAYCKDFTYAEEVNVGFTKKLLEFSLHQKKLKKFIFISSIIIYDNAELPPVSENAKLYLHYSNYSFTKGIAEHYVNHFREKLGLPAVVFRLANIYGPYQDFTDSPFLVPSKIIQAITEKRIEVFTLTPRRDWIYSEDAATAIVKSLDVPAVGIFNLASGEPSSVEDIIKETSAQLNVPYASLNKPASGPVNFYCDITKITETFRWRPVVPLRQGIEKTIQYIRDNLGNK